jgi:hypothetical protein
VKALLTIVQLMAHGPGGADAGSHVSEFVPVQSPSRLPLMVTPDCVTETVCPATVSDPVRAVVDELAATEKKTVPLPLPDAPDVIVTKDELLTAVHVQPDWASTLIVPVPPLEPNDEGAAVRTLKVQGGPPENAVTSATLASEPCGFE